ncbi:hypothetical protein CALCODRAFT_60962 [Calocera cornea HHB12733]|uniref:Uncharacterized protein n=1 Tax=Calocera cornea HHB12733 TaxID=1353952 RepID=A0A165DNJ1_9BASI|nr:hypothetical protein CALCODRAFT_60962 [Calocera cornea HHB12733]
MSILSISPWISTVVAEDLVYMRNAVLVLVVSTAVPLLPWVEPLFALMAVPCFCTSAQCFNYDTSITENCISDQQRVVSWSVAIGRVRGILPARLEYTLAGIVPSSVERDSSGIRTKNKGFS